MVDPAATLAPVGETEATVSAGGGAVGVAAAWLLCSWSTATKPPAATTSDDGDTDDSDQPAPWDRCRVRACSPAMAAGILPGVTGRV